MLSEIKWNILDLYCGAGTIGLTLKKLWIWEKLLWVEIVEDAVKDANINAQINNLSQDSRFIADKAENINFESENIWLVVIDPPRVGLHKNVVNYLIELKKQFQFPLLYISCNPVTMARDLKLLKEWGFDLKNLKAVDMFPHTHHIEMVWLLK
jgi:tRNA/tmRNA/rRNA uracil-C5-methylase (TrmA/RlmC/RlmD family)